MEINPEEYTEILFRYKSEILEKEVEEILWAKNADTEKGLYQLHSIPFYGPKIATGDIFHATIDLIEKCLSYRNTVEESGNSIIQVLINETDLTQEEIINSFEELLCKVEIVDENFFSMQVPATKNYAVINKVLENYVQKQILGYAEPCLSKKHRKDLKKGGLKY
jgi:hypothetical protein